MRHWLISALFLSLPLFAQEEYALPHLDAAHLGGGVEASIGKVIKADPYEKMWIHQNKMFSIGAFIRIHTLPTDSCAFAEDFGYPTFSAGLLYGNFRGVEMKKLPAPDWGMAQPVDYTSRMGHAFTAYGSFERPLGRTAHWEWGYSFSTGLGFSTHIYDRERNVDNEILGSRWNIFFGAGVYASYRIASQWAVRGAIDFRHLSNGATARPNKGANTLTPTLSLLYLPPTTPVSVSPRSRRPFRKYWKVNAIVGIGGKTLLEDWLIKQYQTPPSSPEYRRGRLHFFSSYSLQANLMYRYARRWASGLGIDVNYTTAAKHIQALDRSKGSKLSHSPWSLGLAARHEVFYGRLSMSATLGYYLYRKMGEVAILDEKPYYERIGLRYRFPKAKGCFVGAEVKAHGTKADFTEIIIGFDF